MIPIFMEGLEILKMMIMLDSINKQKDEIISKLKKNIRKKAMKNVEKNIAYNQKKISDFSKDELRKLVKKEEKEVRKGYRNLSIAALLALFGINTF